MSARKERVGGARMGVEAHEVLDDRDTLRLTVRAGAEQAMVRGDQEGIGILAVDSEAMDMRLRGELRNADRLGIRRWELANGNRGGDCSDGEKKVERFHRGG